MSKSVRDGLSPLALHEINKSLTALENFFELYSQGNDFRNDIYTIEFLKSRIAILKDFVRDPMPLPQPNSASKSAEAISTAVLVDDDILVRMTWEISAQMNGKKLIVFASPTEFFEELKRFDLYTPIYIDANLGDGIRGEDFARQLRALGFTELYLATGYDSSYFSGASGLFNGIVGKEPPWVKH